MEVIEKIKQIIRETCEAESNPHGLGALTHHIPLVAKCAKKLAKKLHADEEIVEIAAWLHDYASILNKDWIEDHHVHGAILARELLVKYKYSPEKIEIITDAIESHRGSKPGEHKTIESKIVASADAMSHIIDAYELLHYAYTLKKLDPDEGANWVARKIERSWKKMMPEAKEMVKDRYDAIKLILITKTSEAR